MRNDCFLYFNLHVSTQKYRSLGLNEIRHFVDLFCSYLFMNDIFICKYNLQIF
jgi:hypothetical protein